MLVHDLSITEPFWWYVFVLDCVCLAANGWRPHYRFSHTGRFIGFDTGRPAHGIISRSRLVPAWEKGQKRALAPSAKGFQALWIQSPFPRVVLKGPQKLGETAERQNAQRNIWFSDLNSCTAKGSLGNDISTVIHKSPPCRLPLLFARRSRSHWHVCVNFQSTVAYKQLWNFAVPVGRTL